MKAMTSTRYGSADVLKMAELQIPTPKDNEVLIKVHASSINAGDWHLMRGKPYLMRLVFGLFRPKITVLGADVAGVVEAVGKKVTQFKPGDAVFGDISNGGFGGFSEYVCAKEKYLTLKPRNVTFEQAAAVPAAGQTALQGIRDYGKIKEGQKVLVNGASGGVGSFAVQIAKYYGAEVTAVCSTQKMDMVRSLGADHVIDYTKEDPTQGGQLYDLVFDAAAFRDFLDYKRCLRTKGTYVMAGGHLKQLMKLNFIGLQPWKKGGRDMRGYLVKPNQKDMQVLKELLEINAIRPPIDKTYTLPETADAIRRLEQRKVQGKLVISVA